jgi:hypothetical protein
MHAVLRDRQGHRWFVSRRDGVDFADVISRGFDLGIDLRGSACC